MATFTCKHIRDYARRLAEVPGAQQPVEADDPAEAARRFIGSNVDIFPTFWLSRASVQVNDEADPTRQYWFGRADDPPILCKRTEDIPERGPAAVVVIGEGAEGPEAFVDDYHDGFLRRTGPHSVPLALEYGFTISHPVLVSISSGVSWDPEWGRLET